MGLKHNTVIFNPVSEGYSDPGSDEDFRMSIEHFMPPCAFVLGSYCDPDCELLKDVQGAFQSAIEGQVGNTVPDEALQPLSDVYVRRGEIIPTGDRLLRAIELAHGYEKLTKEKADCVVLSESGGVFGIG